MSWLGEAWDAGLKSLANHWQSAPYCFQLLPRLFFWHAEWLLQYIADKSLIYWPNPGTLTVGTGSVQLTSSLRYIIWYKRKIFCFSIKSSQSELISTRRLTVLFFPFQLGFPGLTIPEISAVQLRRQFFCEKMQIYFSGESSCPKFSANSFKKDVCSSCLQKIQGPHSQHFIFFATYK
jgi:hypothetical protein